MFTSISLRTLFGIVAFAAIATAVLLRPTFVVASVTWSLTLLVLGISIVAATFTRGKTRAFWFGFAFFGRTHMVLAVAPWFDNHTGEFIVTRQLLDRLGAVFKYDVAKLPEMPGIWSNLQWAYNDSPKSSFRYLSYLMAGQSIFSLAIGYIGGLGGRFFYARHAAMKTT